MPLTASWQPPAVKAAYRSAVLPAVVLADGTACREFDVLHRLLETLDVPVVRLSGVGGDVITAPVGGEGGVLLIGRQRIRPIVAWVRHGTTAAIYLQMVRRGDDGAGLQGAQCWSRLLEAITASAATALPGGSPGFATQLIEASRHGVRVPRTFVTTNAEAATHHFTGSRVIAKIPDSRPLALAPNPRLAPSPVHGLAGGAEGTAPVVVQEYVAHSRELRVYYTGGGIAAFEVRKPEPDSIWVEPESVTVAKTRCPPRLADLVGRLAAAWGLQYGAFDFLITRSGEPLFLEVNADGDWLWFERKAHWQGISFMVAAMISELYARNRRSKVV